MNSFETLLSINVNEKTEKKGKLTYLSWAYAWAELKKKYPESFYTVYPNAEGWIYHTDGRTCWVMTGVTLVDGDKSIEHIEHLPVMDNRNMSIPLERVTSRDVNDSIQRSLTKAIARHGLGLYIYAGEDLPDNSFEEEEEAKAKNTPVIQHNAPVLCSSCKNPIKATKTLTVQEVAKSTKERYGQPLCVSCVNKRASEEASR